MPRNQQETRSLEGSDYVILNDRVLGIGSYSIVKLAKHKTTQQLAAAKLIDLSVHTQEYEQELSALLAVGEHPNVISCVHHEKSDLTRLGTIFLEYLQEETLYSFIQAQGPSTEALSLAIFSSLVNAVRHIHSKHLVHNDLKPENVMFNPSTMVVKLFDFGLSELVKPEAPLSSNSGGSPLYMAPEIHKPECHNPMCSDVWSLGIILYELLTGETPYSNCESLQDLKDVLESEEAISFPATLSQGVRDLLTKLLCFDPDSRPTASDLHNYVEKLRKSLEDTSTPQRVSPMSCEQISPSPIRLDGRVGRSDTSDDESEDSDGTCSSSA